VHVDLKYVLQGVGVHAERIMYHPRLFAPHLPCSAPSHHNHVLSLMCRCRSASIRLIICDDSLSSLLSCYAMMRIIIIVLVRTRLVHHSTKIHGLRESIIAFPRNSTSNTLPQAGCPHDTPSNPSRSSFSGLYARVYGRP
jgi:hypothetical protein